MVDQLHRFAYDAKLRQPACVLLQAAFGCNYSLTHRFPSDTWLLAPTPDMRVYAISEEVLSKLVEATKKFVEQSQMRLQNNSQSKQRSTR